VFFAIGVGLYYGAPIIYNQFVKPVEEHTVQIGDLQVQQKQSATESSERVGELQKQIDTLTSLRDKDKEKIAEVQADLKKAVGWQEADQQLATRQGKLEARLDDFESLQRSFQSTLAELKVASQEDSKRVDAVEKMVRGQEAPLSTMRQEVSLIKVMELVTRSRAAMVDRNYGVAQSDLQSARTLLSVLQAKAQTYQTASIQSMIERIDLALNNLANNPSLADKDLDVIWQLLIQGLPASADEVLPTSAPVPLPTVVPTVLPEQIVTPTS
jgi:chaperonin cofactor prefoldin